MLPHAATWSAFALVSVGLVLTPGPNMIYCVSRSLSQGRAAGLMSVAGVGAGFLFYLACAALGLTAILLAVPFAYDALRFGGAAYLLWLAWQALKPGAKALFTPSTLPHDRSSRLFLMGMTTNILNPKIAFFYVSLLPQFIDPAGSVLAQSFILGVTQIAISVSINALIVCMAGSLVKFLTRRPTWLAAQRWIMGLVLAGLALRLATDTRR